MKVNFCILFYLSLPFTSFANSSLCPDPPINDDPCNSSINPPYDLTGGGSHVGTTCCARGPEDLNPDGSPADFGSLHCADSTSLSAVWYVYATDSTEIGYSILLEETDEDAAGGPISIEVYWGDEDQGCIGFDDVVASSCFEVSTSLNVTKCSQSGLFLFIKISTNNIINQCGKFKISIVPNLNDNIADKCSDLANTETISLIHDSFFEDILICTTGSLEFACAENINIGGCDAFTEMPTIWFQLESEDNAALMYSTVESFGDWDPVWAVFSGPDCDNLSVIDFGDTPPCSNGDNTVEVHQTSIFDEEDNYWIMVTADPNSIPSTGMGDPGFELCLLATVNATICLGELEGGACEDESLIIEVTEREIDSLPLNGPFAQGEEITIHISFLYDASENSDDWLIGFIPVFGKGWDLSNFDFAANAPEGNGITAGWFEEGTDKAPTIKEDTPILCTYTDGDGNLQLCNWLCDSCDECPTIGMAIDDPLPSGYFWVSEGSNPGCGNNGSPGEGWGIGSEYAEVDWTFTLRTKEFENMEDCADSIDLSIRFQTLSHGVAGCWEDPYGECLLDRMMFSPSWVIACEGPLGVNTIEPNNVLIYPNPSNDVFNIDIQDHTNTIYTIIDIMGRVIEKGDVSRNMKISLGDEIKGIYILKLQKKNQKISTYHRLLRI